MNSSLSKNTTSPSKNLNLFSDEVKNQILKYLYSHVNVDLNFERIKDEEDLDHIRNNDYIICPRLSGSRSWIIFFKMNDCYYAVTFPKHSQYKKHKIVIHPINLTVAPAFYNGTIMEGIYFKADESKYLVIDEVYILAGENQLLKPKDDRLNNLCRYLKKFVSQNTIYEMNVSKFYYINKKNLTNLYEKIKSDNRIQEIIFYPNIFGNKIYNYTIIVSDLVDNVIKISTFYLQKTKSPDVYHLLSTESKSKIDIAYIPDMETSKKCKQWFKFQKTSEILVKCTWRSDKNKWIPMELIETELSEVDSE